MPSQLERCRVLPRCAQYSLLAAASLATLLSAEPLTPTPAEQAARESLGGRLPGARLLWACGGKIMHSRLLPWFPQRLTPEGVQEDRPRWSPDGKWFVCQRTRGVTWDLYLRSADFAEERLLLAGAHTADWCDSGRAVTAVVQHSGLNEPAGYRVVKYTVATGDTATIHDSRDPGYNGYVLMQSAELHPAGRYLLGFTIEDSHNTYIIDTEQPRYLFNAQMDRGDCSPGWAPDGSYLTTTARTSTRPVLNAPFDASLGMVGLSAQFCGLTTALQYYIHGHRVCQDGQWLTGGVLWVGGSLSGNREVYVWDLADWDRDAHAVRLTFETVEDANPSLHTSAVDQGAAVLLVAPSLVRFSVVAGGTVPPPQEVRVANGGMLALGPVSVSGAPAWLSVQQGGSGEMQTLGLSVSAGTLVPGEYTDTLRISCTDASNSPVQLIVKLLITGMRQPDVVSGLVPGLNVLYYALAIPDSLPVFATMSPVKADSVDSIFFPPASWEFAGSGRRDSVGSVFSGYVCVDRDDDYTFYVNSDEGAALYVGDTRVVDNGGPHVMREDSGTIGLLTGCHRFRVEHVEADGEAGLILQWRRTGGSKHVTPSGSLFRVPLAMGAIVLRSPAGGEEWVAGSVQYVDFEVANLSQVVVELSLDGGETYGNGMWTADEGQPGWGHLPISLPDTATTTAVLKVAPYLGGTGAVYSEAFSIVRSGAARVVSQGRVPGPVLLVRGSEVEFMDGDTPAERPVVVDTRGRVVCRLTRSGGSWRAQGLRAGLWLLVWRECGVERSRRFRVL